MMRILRKAGIVVLTAAAAVFAAGVAQAGFIAYNDNVYISGETLAPNVTTIQMVSNGTASGSLKDIGSGNAVATLTITNAGAPANVTNPADAWGGCTPVAGTPAYNAFNSVMSLHGEVQYGSSNGWSIDYTFSGLDPSKEYEFIGGVNRFDPTTGNPANETTADYLTRLSRFTLVGADSFSNVSTTTPSLIAAIPTGALATTTVANDSYVFCAALNYTNGYIVDFANIKPGNDGQFTIHMSPESYYKVYSFGGMELIQTPEPATLGLLAIGGVMALARRRKNAKA
jgi:hypothetical protein